MVILEIHRLWRSSFFWKCSKFNVYFQNGEKNWEKVFCFWNNSIWIGCVILSLLRRKHLLSTVNVLASSLKTLHSTTIDFSQTKKKKNWEKGFRFWDNINWIGCVKLSLLRREYLSSAVNVLTSRIKVLHRTNIDFFQLNYVQRDEQIW